MRRTCLRLSQLRWFWLAGWSWGVPRRSLAGEDRPRGLIDVAWSRMRPARRLSFSGKCFNSLPNK
eukprot:10011168-Alexandrium_andersonii.AAC.1